MHGFWQFVVDHQAILGGGIGSAGWAVYVHFFPVRESKSNGAAATVTQSGTGIASGRDTVISAPVSIGLDEKKIGEQIAAAQKPLTDRLERLVAQISREKGVPRSRSASTQRPMNSSREEIAQLRLGPAELASFAQRAQALIDQGNLDGACTALAEGRARAHKLREQSSRYKVAFLAREAEIDHLQLAYRSAAAKYQEAAALAAGFDPDSRWHFLIRHAVELYSHGNEFGDNDALLQAIAAFRAAMNEYTREREPLDWAATQNNLGNALQRLGERESGTAPALRRRSPPFARR
jgi:hypothetical protein